jgi:hydrogenase maturation factor
VSSPTAGPDACAAAGRCITCGDEGIPMEVVSVSADTATCQDGDAVIHEVMVDLVAPVAPGDAILVHAGTAIGRQRGVL